MRTVNGHPLIQEREQESFIAGKTVSVEDLRENLLNSAEPSNSSKTHWEKPSNARELAKQANEIATKILNGEIDLIVAAKYSAIIRATSQLLSLEVAKARLDRAKIDLDL